MIKPSQLAPVLLALLLGAAPLLAQTAPDPQTDAAKESAEQDTGANGPDQPVTATPGETMPEAAPASGNRSPFDYQSSEEISEDLSVSFPVDI